MVVILCDNEYSWNNFEFYHDLIIFIKFCLLVNKREKWKM